MPTCWLGAALEQLDERVAGDLLGEARAAGAEHAALAVEQHLGGDRRSAWGRCASASSNRDSPRPLDIAWFCSGHSPPLSQIGQSSGWLISSNSMTPCCALSATAEVSWVRTTMPSVHGRRAGGQRLALALRPRPGTGGRRRPGRAAGGRRTAGSGCRACSAARITRVPLGTLTSNAVDGERDQVVDRRRLLRAVVVTVIGVRSARRRSTRPGRTGSRRPSGAATYSSRKYWMRRGDRAGRAVAEGAERPAEDVVAEVEQELSRSPRCPRRVSSRSQDLDQPVGALAARRALAARLVLVELGPAQHRADHAGGLVEDLQRPGAEHRAGRARPPRSRAGRRGARRSASGSTSRPGVQNFSSCPSRTPPARSSSSRSVMPSGASYWPGLGDVPGEREDAEARGLLGAHARRTSRRRCRR